MFSSQGKKYVDPDYNPEKPLIPHGLSVVTTAPADFIFTTPAYPQRHLEAANLLGADLPVSHFACFGVQADEQCFVQLSHSEHEKVLVKCNQLRFKYTLQPHDTTFTSTPHVRLFTTLLVGNASICYLEEACSPRN